MIACVERANNFSYSLFTYCFLSKFSIIKACHNLLSNGHVLSLVFFVYTGAIQKRNLYRFDNLFFGYWYVISEKLFVFEAQKIEQCVLHCVERTVPFHVLVSIEIDAVGYSNEHVAVGHAVILGSPTLIQPQSGSIIVQM